MDHMPYTRVTLPPGQQPDIHRTCVADCYTVGELTVTSEDRDSIVQVYPAEQWIEAIVFAADGYPLYSLRNPEAWKAIAKAESQPMIEQIRKEGTS